MAMRRTIAAHRLIGRIKRRPGNGKEKGEAVKRTTG
jgi:hypothetical protein